MDNPKHNITAANYETWLIRRIENDLDADEMRTLDAFLATHPEYRAEMEAFEKTVLVPDANVVFANKESLYRREIRVVALWYRRPQLWAAAATIALLLGVGFWWFATDSAFHQGVATVDKAGAQPAADTVQRHSVGVIPFDIAASKPEEEGGLNATAPQPELQRATQRPTNKTSTHLTAASEKMLTAVVTNRQPDALQPIQIDGVIQFVVTTPTKPLAARPVPPDALDPYAARSPKAESKPVRFLAGALRAGGKDNLARAFEHYVALDDKRIEISFNSHNLDLHKTLFPDR